jgi:anhydro-N-acetylmuramic acid kinase
MAALPGRTGAEVVPAEKVGWRGDAVEAECFAFLGARRLVDLPISFPTTTGVKQPMTGGQLAGI